VTFCHVSADDNDLREFDYERYLMEEVELRHIVDNPAMSMVSALSYCLQGSKKRFFFKKPNPLVFLGFGVLLGFGTSRKNR